MSATSADMAITSAYNESITLTGVLVGCARASQSSINQIFMTLCRFSHGTSVIEVSISQVSIRLCPHIQTTLSPFELTMKLSSLYISLLTIALCSCADSAWSQLRIVTYNTNTFGTEVGSSNIRTVRPEADIVFQAIGEEVVNGFARPADIILLQEQQQPDTTTANLVTRLNNIYSSQGITYARGFRVGDSTSGSGFGTPSEFELRQSVVYRTDSVSLISEDSFGILEEGITQSRETLLHQFRPVGYGADADLYIFNSHFAASDTNTDRIQRESEANQIRTYIDDNGLGNSNVIVGGDLNLADNFSTSNSTDFGERSPLQILADTGPGRVLDPLFPGGEEVNFQIFDAGVPNTQEGVNLAPFLTQSPSGQGGFLVGGGIDDRFDFLLQSDELLDGEGVASIDSSLRSFGNNGSTNNTQINNGNTITLNGVTSFTTAEVLDALDAASDHLPVIEDFQLPSVLEAFLVDVVPETVEQNSAVDLMFSIRNAADVLVALGADELDFQFVSSGDIVGSGVGVDEALGSVFTGLINLDTTQVGQRSGLLSITSNSQSVVNGAVSIPISFTVVSAVPEPGSLALIAFVGATALTRRRR